MYVGGSFAPPFDDAKIAEYEALANGASPDVKAAMLNLLGVLKEWWELPESMRTGTRHPHFPRAVQVPLEVGHASALQQSLPLKAELAELSNARDTGIFDNLTGDLRNAAFHLLWFANEIRLSREPMTNDKLN